MARHLKPQQLPPTTVRSAPLRRMRSILAGDDTVGTKILAPMPQGKASVICRASPSAVGWRVTSNHSSCRRRRSDRRHRGECVRSWRETTPSARRSLRRCLACARRRPRRHRDCHPTRQTTPAGVTLRDRRLAKAPRAPIRHRTARVARAWRQMSQPPSTSSAAPSAGRNQPPISATGTARTIASAAM